MITLLESILGNLEKDTNFLDIYKISRGVVSPGLADLYIRLRERARISQLWVFGLQPVVGAIRNLDQFNDILQPAVKRIITSLTSAASHAEQTLKEHDSLMVLEIINTKIKCLEQIDKVGSKKFALWKTLGKEDISSMALDEKIKLFCDNTRENKWATQDQMAAAVTDFKKIKFPCPSDVKMQTNEDGEYWLEFEFTLL